ncbi:MazG-like pyrophosphatase [Agrobacterium phage 7-7-1]|uniref:Uncharacterized protein n=1 Tax=Agrobacterium phage 7-7-1 TaxID=1161931 RepID=J7FAQ6_9CAUD|nr:MazG-like pyrophosphatase [Agrobacterium phage 7-7-1]AFH19728.1 hypothetical protein 7-7-1_00030 [Agrobacterium phage 7-7-1]
MFNELPIGAVVRLRNGKTVTIIEKPVERPFSAEYVVWAKSVSGDVDTWTKTGEFLVDCTDGYDMVDVVNYGPVGTVDPDVAEIDRLIAQLRELGAPTPKTCGALVPVIDRQAMIQTLRGLIPPTRVKAPVVAAVAEALKEDETESRIRSLLHIYRRCSIDPAPPIRRSDSLRNMATHIGFVENVTRAIEDAFEIKITDEIRDEWEKVQDVYQTVKRLQNPPKPINRIDRTDVENFRTGNYAERDSFNQYQKIATRSAIYPGQGTPFGVMYAALGLAEAGEIQNKVKKMFRDDGVIEFIDTPFREGDNLVRFKTITPERRLAIMKEMGGNLWYLAALAKEIGSTLSEIAFMNLDELCGRTERDTLNGDGDNR